MKSKNGTLFFLSICLFLINTELHGQMVGISPPGINAPAEKIKISGFFIKIGTGIPFFNFNKLPVLNSTPPKYWAQMPISDGSMGAQLGFHFETGITLEIPGQNERLISFYFYPVVFSYMQNGFDWSRFGGFFTDKSIYTNPFNAFDIAQRYGISVRVKDHISTSLYYRPGLMFPLPFEVLYMNATNGALFQIAGVMSTSDYAPIFQMSHGLGLEFKYNYISLSAELYYAQPTFDVTYIDNKAEEPINYRIRGKIPISLLNVSVAVNF